MAWGLAADNLELFSELLSCAFTYKENSVKLTLLQALPIEIVYLIYIERKPQNLAQLKFALPYLQSMDTPAAHLLSARLCLDGNGDIQGIEANKAAFRHLKICIGHAGFTQLAPNAQAGYHYRLALLYRDGSGDIQGVEAKKAAFRHLKICIGHAGFTQLTPRAQAVSHYGLAVLYRVGLGDIQGVEANKSAFRHFETCIGHAGFSQQRKDIPKAVDYPVAKRLRYSHAADIDQIPFYEAGGRTFKK